MTIVLWIIGGIVAVFLLTVVRGAPYVPSFRRRIEAVFTHGYPLRSNDVVVDLGSGDGVVLRAVSRLGARAVGVEINPFLALLSRLLSTNDTAVRVVCTDMFLLRPPNDMTVVYVFGESRSLPLIDALVERWASELGRELTLVSHGFELKDRPVYARYEGYIIYKFSPLHNS